eukprot:COSAG05_NODE_79_length_21178_cov_133.299492_1_plen_119_part_00
MAVQPIIEEQNSVIVNNMITVATDIKKLCLPSKSEISSCEPMQIEDAVAKSSCAPAECNLITSSHNLLALNSGVKTPNVEPSDPLLEINVGFDSDGRCISNNYRVRQPHFTTYSDILH